MNGTHRAALELLEMGLPITICPNHGGWSNADKRPLGNGWEQGGPGNEWQHKVWSPDEIERAFRAFPDANVGVQLGERSGLIDCETDSESEVQDLGRLFDGTVPQTPSFRSRRGTHHFLAFHQDLQSTGKAVIHFGRLGCRIGADGKGAHSIIPPSVAGGVRRQWLDGLALGEITPAQLSEAVLVRLLEAAEPVCESERHDLDAQHAGDIDEPVAAMMRLTVKADEQDGSKRLLACCCRCVEHDLTDVDAIAAIRLYGEQKPFPAKWTDAEIKQRLADAEKKAVRGSAVLLSNGRRVATTNEEGKATTIVVARSLPEVLADVRNRTGDWPRRVGSALFVHDSRHGVGWLEKQAALFGYLRSRCKVRWHAGNEFCGPGEVFEELRRTGTVYLAVEPLPHHPRLDRHYYACDEIPLGNGAAFAELLDRFNPATDIDRDLIQAMFMTPGWGGPPGLRPAFNITSDHGRGMGKTSLAEKVGLVWGGVLSFSRNEDATVIKKRLLSPEGLTKRVAILDNVKSRAFSWPELESLITTDTISGYRNFIGESSRPNCITWIVTLNGANLSTDMTQRMVQIKLDMPQRSASWEDETRDFILKNQNAIIGDILAALHAEQHPLQRFSRWASWEREILQRLPEPGEAQRVILERQAACDVEEEEADILTEHIADQLWKLKYNHRTDQVFLPSGVVADWYNRAMNTREKSGAVTRIIKQLIDESRLPRIVVNRTNERGKGFVWIGEEADIDEHVKTDIKHRIDQREADRRRDGQDR